MIKDNFYVIRFGYSHTMSDPIQYLSVFGSIDCFLATCSHDFVILLSTDFDGPLSLPASPSRRPQTNRSNHPLKEVTRSLSLSVGTSSHQPSNHIPTFQSDMDPQHFDNEANLDRCTSASSVTIPEKDKWRYTPPRSASVSADSTRGIVVVCPGPTQRLRNTGSLDCLSRHSRHDLMESDLKRLRQIPSFLPLRGSSANLSSPTSEMSEAFAGKRYIPPLKSVDVSKLRSLVDDYEQCIRRRTEAVYQTQTRIIGLQNKIDYEVQRLLSYLKAREKGIIPSPLRHSKQSASPGSPTSPQTVKLAGRQQMDSVVLQTSQVSGLIDQCTSVIDNLCIALEQLNQSLPESKRLKPLEISLPKR
ncbi:hypothetical protein X801_05838 [Opisthorchis viverrini]|uniref:BLOC-1-related complex subunit 5 n=1 Tax=Opisthorchis viverrini TaxID=6198 RepID=A0A1S8WUU8_OPIVI|nr:hypothetical protein X801_05838 [Opisthorchis viverrini]